MILVRRPESNTDAPLGRSVSRQAKLRRDKAMLIKMALKGWLTDSCLRSPRVISEVRTTEMSIRKNKYFTWKELKSRKLGTNGSDREGAAKAYCQLVKDSQPRFFGSFASWQKNKSLYSRELESWMRLRDFQHWSKWCWSGHQHRTKYFAITLFLIGLLTD